MSPEVSMSSLLNLRAFVAIAALVCLCVSSNVGLQFFPLPAGRSQVAQDVREHPAKQALKAPQADAQSFRVPMMAQSRKGADNEPQSNQLIALPSNRFGSPRDTRFAIEIGYAVSFLTSVPTAPRRGRAPPSLV